MLPDTTKLIEAMAEARSTAEPQVIENYSPAFLPPGDYLNEFCLFLKPEITRLAQTFVSRILDLLVERVSSAAMESSGALVIPGAYLASTSLMEGHYGVISTVSRRGLSGLTPEAKDALVQHFGDFPGSAILGGHQILDRYPQLDAHSLNALVTASGSLKLAPGTYASAIDIDGDDCVALNGFNPEQILHFTSRSAQILVLGLRTSMPWQKLRQEWTGATDPRKATPGSLRRQLADRADWFGLDQVDAGNNGFHVSAGPIEGMSEICRFFGETDDAITPLSSTFGRLATRDGVAERTIADSVLNPLTTTGRSLFDETEEMSSREAIRVLLKLQRPTGSDG